MSTYWEREAMRREQEKEHREYLESMQFDIVKGLELVNQIGMTPQRALRELFPEAMLTMFTDGIMTQKYMKGFLEFIEGLCKKGDEWEEMILSFPEWILYQVACTTTRKLRMAGDERGTGILMPEVLENLALFMKDSDIPFEINETLVTTPLYLLALQDKVQLWDHLQAALVKELEVEGAEEGAGGSSSSRARGACSS